MATYTLNVEIDIEDLKILKEEGYKLCVAKKVNNLYTVVWSGDTDYLTNNQFRWTEEYQVFGVNKFTEGALVEAATNEEHIEFGQTCTIDESGVVGSATGTADSSGKFQVVTNYGNIALGVNGLLNGRWAPVFVTPTEVIGMATFEPFVSMQVWFSSDMVTGTMIFDSDSQAAQVKYNGEELEKTIAFKSGSWVAV